jgi:TonB family protein
LERHNNVREENKAAGDLNFVVKHCPMQRLLILFSLFSLMAVGQTQPNTDLPVVAHRRVPGTYCELAQVGTLHVNDSGVVVHVTESGENLYPSALSHSLGFVEYAASDLSSDDRENAFYAARDAGFQLRVGHPASIQVLPTMQLVNSMPDVSCVDLKSAQKTLESQPVPEQIYNAGSKDVTPPEKTAGDQPTYPRNARRRGLQGDVAISFILKEDGSPTYIFVAESLDPELDESAMDAVRGWRFKPAVKDGRPVAAAISVKVHFGLYMP